MPAGAASAAAGDATVRVAHLSPDAPSVHVHVNGAKALSGVLYKSVSKYLSVPPGQYRFEARPGPLARTPTPARTPAAHPRRTPSPYADVEPTCGSDCGIRTCAQDRR